MGIDCEDLDKRRVRLKESIERLKREKLEIEEELENAKNFHRKATAFFEQLGLNPADIFRTPLPTDAIPF